MNELTKFNNPTMSSLEIVDLINQVRKEEADEKGEEFTKLLHKNFLAKVPKVLGEVTAAKFLATVKYEKNNNSFGDQKIYNLPQREAFLMVMSESYSVQAKLYDAYQDLVKKVKNLISQPHIPLERTDKIVEESKDVRKKFTGTLKSHGIEGTGYRDITVNMKKPFNLEGYKKDQYSDKLLIATMLAEDIATHSLSKSDADGFREVNPITTGASKTVADFYKEHMGITDFRKGIIEDEKIPTIREKKIFKGLKRKNEIK